MVTFSNTRYFVHLPACLLSLFLGACEDKTSGPPPTMRSLNDTGITQCAEGFSNLDSCPINGFRGQDADYGRDFTDNNDGDGRSGFSYTKLDINGKSLPSDATEWACVIDNVTNLVWEKKASDGGLQDSSNTYTWYSLNENTNGGNMGLINFGNCSESKCDTESYVRRTNSRKLCGYSYWRIPTLTELHSLVDYGKLNAPQIEYNYFPNTESGIY